VNKEIWRDRNYTLKYHYNVIFYYICVRMSVCVHMYMCVCVCVCVCVNTVVYISQSAVEVVQKDLAGIEINLKYHNLTVQTNAQTHTHIHIHALLHVCACMYERTLTF
jgi:hypothetical protein